MCVASHGDVLSRGAKFHCDTDFVDQIACRWTDQMAPKNRFEYLQGFLQNHRYPYLRARDLEREFTDFIINAFFFELFFGFAH